MNQTAWPQDKCLTCNYFHTTGSLPGGNKIPIGECRRHCPTFMPTRNDDRDDGMDNLALWGQWPKVMDGSWCGEFDTEK